METEIWKDIPGYGNHYQASNLGNIRVKDRVVEKFSVLANKVVKQYYKARILTPSKSSKYGHVNVHLGFDKTKKNVAVHTLVLLAFVGPRPEGMECCHNNGIAYDNRLENLRWDTHLANNADRKAHGRYKVGPEHHMYGRKMPEEHKQRLIAMHTGRKRSDQTKKKMSEASKRVWEERRYA